MNVSDNLYKEKDRQYFGAVKTAVFRRLENKTFGVVLDIGGGDGASARYAIDQDFAKKVVVLDPYGSFEESERIELHKKSAEDQEFFDEFSERAFEFDTIFCFDVLEHLVDPWSVLRAASRVLSPRGRLIVCAPNARFVALTVPLILFGRFDYKASGVMDLTHIRWFTRSTLIEMIEEAGYEVKEVKAIIEPRVRAVNFLTFGVFRRFFEYQYIVEAEKRQS